MSILVCMSDGEELVCVKNGVYLEQTFAEGTPYRLFSSDVWRCPTCKTQIARTASEPVAEYWQETYEASVGRLNPTRRRFH